MEASRRQGALLVDHGKAPSPVPDAYGDEGCRRWVTKNVMQEPTSGRDAGDYTDH